MALITAEDFSARLAAICSGGRGSGLPRRQRDIAVVLASTTLSMKPGSLYSEAEINQSLECWLGEVCPSLLLDPVTLRRELVDRNFLTRDDRGTHYAPGPGPVEWSFDERIADIDPVAVIADANAERERRRRDHLEARATSDEISRR